MFWFYCIIMVAIVIIRVRDHEKDFVEATIGAILWPVLLIDILVNEMGESDRENKK